MVKKNVIWRDNQDTDNFELSFMSDIETEPTVLHLARNEQDMHNEKYWEVDIPTQSTVGSMILDETLPIKNDLTVVNSNVKELKDCCGEVQGELITTKVTLTDHEDRLVDLDERLLKEVADRIEGDNVLELAIEAEKDSRVEAIADLTAKLDTESNTRKTSDDELAARIDSITTIESYNDSSSIAINKTDKVLTVSTPYAGTQDKIIESIVGGTFNNDSKVLSVFSGAYQIYELELKLEEGSYFTLNKHNVTYEPKTSTDWVYNSSGIALEKTTGNSTTRISILPFIGLPLYTDDNLRIGCLSVGVGGAAIQVVSNSVVSTRYPAAASLVYNNNTGLYYYRMFIPVASTSAYDSYTVQLGRLTFATSQLSAL